MAQLNTSGYGCLDVKDLAVESTYKFGAIALFIPIRWGTGSVTGSTSPSLINRKYKRWSGKLRSVHLILAEKQFDPQLISSKTVVYQNTTELQSHSSAGHSS